MARKPEDLKGKIVVPGKIGQAFRAGLRGFARTFYRPTGDKGPRIREDVGVNQWIDSGVWVHGESTNVVGLQYNHRLNHLYVEFLSGSVYLYSGVPTSVAKAFFLAPSLGVAQWQILRDRYPYTPVIQVNKIK